MTEDLQIPTGVGARDEGRLLTTREAASLLAVSPDTLRWWRNWTHTGPPFFRFEGRRGRVRYSRPDLERWLDARRVAGGSRDKDVLISGMREELQAGALESGVLQSGLSG